jgi:hypothetical protein
LYDASVPVFRHALGQLLDLLALARAHVATPPDDGPTEATLLQAQLVPDMLPLATQVQITVNFVARACAPLAGLPLPVAPMVEPSLAALRARVLQVLGWLDTLRPEAMADAGSRLCHSRAGDADVALPGATFLHTYALPNFYFHMTLVYALLRLQGVPVSKGDFDGYHRYPLPPGRSD